MNAPTVKRLQATVDAGRRQRAWFDDLQRRLDVGGWYVLVDADVPHEIFRAMGIDYVVTQWWSALLGAKQVGPAALAALADRGLPDDVDPYNSIPLGASLLDRSEQPWGGLPAPRLVVGSAGHDAHRNLLQVWHDSHGTDVILVDHTPAVVERGAADIASGDGWWDRIADEWETVVGAARLDLLEGQIGELIEWCEAATGRRLDPEALDEVLQLANEQAAWNRRSRDLLAAARPTPIDVADTIPAVMLPQWHRGTPDAAAAARALHDEIDVEIERGAAVVPDERVRLMWVGRGLWFDPGFLQRFADRGAVFVWSMYHALAADAYERRGGPPLRTLAARFAPFPDLLGAPGWVDRWTVNEARRSGVDGAVHLPAAEHRDPAVTTDALRAAGVPVLELDGNNADARSWRADEMAAAVERFIDDEVAPVATARRARETA
ncbi:MAG: 2-hydroxyacyl-CoA dehydratase [Acidimicrobiales bacterium]